MIGYTESLTMQLSCLIIVFYMFYILNKHSKPIKEGAANGENKIDQGD